MIVERLQRSFTNLWIN